MPLDIAKKPLPEKAQAPLVPLVKPDKMKKNITIAIQVVFLLYENIPYLREWFAYHSNLGIDKFYMYDNTGSKGHVTTKGSFATETMNKYGFDFTKILPYTM